MSIITDQLPPWLWPRAAYVHVPFCAHHCGYCDFAIAVGQDARIDDYLDALGREIRQHRARHPPTAPSAPPIAGTATSPWPWARTPASTTTWTPSGGKSASTSTAPS